MIAAAQGNRRQAAWRERGYRDGDTGRTQRMPPTGDAKDGAAYMVGYRSGLQARERRGAS